SVRDARPGRGACRSADRGRLRGTVHPRLLARPNDEQRTTNDRPSTQHATRNWQESTSYRLRTTGYGLAAGRRASTAPLVCAARARGVGGGRWAAPALCAGWGSPRARAGGAGGVRARRPRPPPLLFSAPLSFLILFFTGGF